MTLLQVGKPQCYTVTTLIQTVSIHSSPFGFLNIHYYDHYCNGYQVSTGGKTSRDGAENQ